VHLQEKGRLVGYLVEHPEGEGEVGRAEDARALGDRAMEPDPRDQPRLPGSGPQSVQHLLLHVHGDDRARLPHHLGQRQRKEAGSAAQVDRHVALVDESLEDPPGVIEQLADRSGEPAGMLGRTDVVMTLWSGDVAALAPTPPLHDDLPRKPMVLQHRAFLGAGHIRSHLCSIVAEQETHEDGRESWRRT
jgi:hypothetical protein